MMSSEATSSPVSASTLAYLMRWPVLRLTWLNETFSVSEVAGYKATGQVTSERRKKPFQLARGAMGYSENATDDQRGYHRGTGFQSERGEESLNGVNCGGRRHACFAVEFETRRRGRCCNLRARRGLTSPVPKSGTSREIMRCFQYLAPQGVSNIRESRAPWQRDNPTGSSKPRPRHATPSGEAPRGPDKTADARGAGARGSCRLSPPPLSNWACRC